MIVEDGVRIGIDFGTTNSSAGYCDGTAVHLIPLEGEATVMPSMIYITREGEQLLGHEAIRLYLQQDTGRPATFRPFAMGALAEVHSELVVIRRVYSLVDTSAPGQLFQSVKSALRDPDFTGTRVFDRYYSLEELIAIVLGHVRRRAEAHLGGRVDSVLFGRPVTYADRGLPPETSATVERAAASRMARAAHLAGFRDIEFAFEPVAAAHSWAERAGREAMVFVFDFGGGTLDLAVIRLHPEGRAETLATSGLLLGGDDLDSRLVLRLARHFGAGTTYGPERLPFPDHMLDYMAHWQTIPILSRPPFIQTIRSMRRESSAPVAIAALECLVSRNYGFQLFQEVERGRGARVPGGRYPGPGLPGGIRRRHLDRALVLQRGDGPHHLAARRPAFPYLASLCLPHRVPETGDWDSYHRQVQAGPCFIRQDVLRLSEGERASIAARIRRRIVQGGQHLVTCARRVQGGGSR